MAMYVLVILIVLAIAAIPYILDFMTSMNR